MSRTDSDTATGAQRAPLRPPPHLLRLDRCSLATPTTAATARAALAALSVQAQAATVIATAAPRSSEYGTPLLSRRRHPITIRHRRTNSAARLGLSPLPRPHRRRPHSRAPALVLGYFSAPASAAQAPMAALPAPAQLAWAHQPRVMCATDHIVPFAGQPTAHRRHRPPHLHPLPHSCLICTREPLPTSSRRRFAATPTALCRRSRLIPFPRCLTLPVVWVLRFPHR